MREEPHEGSKSGSVDRSRSQTGTEFRQLYRELAESVRVIEETPNLSSMLESILKHLLEQFQDTLGLNGGRLYERMGDRFRLRRGFGSSRNAPVGLEVPPRYPPHLRTLSNGIVVMRASEAGCDPSFERAVGVSSVFAAIAVGEPNTHVIALSVKEPAKEEQVFYSLTLLRHVINMKIEEQRLTGAIEESRLLQETMLPSSPPALDGFDIDAVSCPAERVSGDLFDYIPISRTRLGIAIADATGHGLPAALLVRDAITGLRMGVEESREIVDVIERLNRVIHRAALSRTFVSLYYGELRGDGTLTYCNAGHNPPFLLRGDSFADLDCGGTVLGPFPSARYQSAETTLGRGDVLVAYTDGVVERQNAKEEQFGTERLREVIRRARAGTAGDMVGAIRDAVARFGSGVPQEDDLTVVVARKT